MPVNAHQFQFQLQAVPTVIVALLAPLFFGLGLWQLDRAEQKRTLAASLEMRSKLPEIQLSTYLPDAGELEFRKVIAAGRFLGSKTVLIENRKHMGKRGFHVITPLLMESGQIVLVNRGWIPGEGKGVTMPDTSDSNTDLSIRGEVRIPQPPALELDLNLAQQQSPPHWPYLTLKNYSAWSGLEILSFQILQAADDSSGFMRRWPRPKVNDAMHTGYAVQWFAFALIVLLIWLRLSIHRTNATSTEV
jgi:surfeit locus 1 family protein